jgi:hypothetical protein
MAASRLATVLRDVASWSLSLPREEDVFQIDLVISTGQRFRCSAAAEDGVVAVCIASVTEAQAAVIRDRVIIKEGLRPVFTEVD